MQPQRILKTEKGITITEIVMVIAVIAIMAGIALPSFLEWQRSLAYRSTAREIASMLQEARTRTVKDNIQHRVEFQTPLLRRYRLTRGTVAMNSLAFPTVVYPWVAIRQDVNLVTAGLANDGAADVVEFLSNGTPEVISAQSIQIQDTSGAVRFTIQVERTGRIFAQ